MFVACTDANIEIYTNSDVGLEKIYASIDNFESSDTRVELNNKKQTVWTEGDEILVFHNSYIRGYTFDGKTGDRSGSFTHTSNYGAPSDNFKVYDQYYAVHLPLTTYGKYSDNTPAFYTTIPATQSYKQDSYGVGTNALLGTSDDGVNFKFKNVFGYLRLGITGSKAVKSIEISGNSNETIAGDLAFNKEAKITSWYQNQSTSITVDCGDGVQLTDEPTYFYVTLPTMTFASGISLTINFSDDTIFPQSTSKSITIERNTIQPMATFDTGGEIEWQTVTIEHTGSTISAPYLFGSSAITGYIYWGDDNMSDINTLESYVYNDGIDSHTVTVKTVNATSFLIENCVGISEIDLTNF